MTNEDFSVFLSSGIGGETIALLDLNAPKTRRQSASCLCLFLCLCLKRRYSFFSFIISEGTSVFSVTFHCLFALKTVKTIHLTHACGFVLDSKLKSSRRICRKHDLVRALWWEKLCNGETSPPPSYKHLSFFLSFNLSKSSRPSLWRSYRMTSPNIFLV